MNFTDEYLKIKEEYSRFQWKKEKQALKDKLLERPIILYGVGFFGGVIVKNFIAEGINVECFCDSNKKGVDQETGLKIISPNELKKEYYNANVLISVANPSTEQAIYEAVEKLGFDKRQIFHFRDAYKFIRKSRVEQVSLKLSEFEQLVNGYNHVFDFLSDKKSKEIVLQTIRSYLFNDLFTYDPPNESYFPEQFKLSDNEVFIDGGLYTGDTTQEFIRRVNSHYKQIIGFDIDQNNLSVAHKNLDFMQGVTIIEKGLWDCTVSKNAELGIMAGSNINSNASDVVDLTSLDEVFANISSDDYPTFIKLDIEGSEKQALLGAQNIIKSAKPKLAVCVYHKPEDIFVLTDLIKSINGDYNFFLRHYSPYIWDTVLYAY